MRMYLKNKKRKVQGKKGESKLKNKVIIRIVSLVFICALMIGVFSSCAAEPYPYDLGEYIKVPAEWNQINVSESEIAIRVKDMIKRARENASIKEIVISRPSEDGDLMDVSLACYRAEEYGKGGVIVEVISDEKCSLIIGEGKYPHELEEALKGRYSGDSFVVRTTLPDSYTVSALAGTAMVYEVSVNNVTDFRLPVYNDAFVQAVSGCKTVSEYEAELYERAKEDIVWETLVRLSEVTQYPEDELETHRGDYVTYYTDLASKADMSLEQYVGKKFFVSLADFHKEAEIYARNTVKNDLLMYYIERKHGIEISDSEYNELAQKYVNEFELKSVSELEEIFGAEFVNKTVLYDKVLAYIAENVKVTEDIV